MEEQKELTEEELKELKRRKRALRKKRMERKKAREQMRVRSLLDDEERPHLVESPEERCKRLYDRARKKMSFAAHMYRREDQADMFRQAAELFGEVPGYEEADALREKCQRKAKEHRELYIEETYARIEKQLAGAKTLVDCQKIREGISAIADFKDMEDMRRACDALEQRIVKKEQMKKILKFLLTAVVIVAAVIVIVYIESTIKI